MAVTVLDEYYLAITLLATVGYQLIFFAIAYTFKFDKVTDFAGGTNFVGLAALTLAMSGSHSVRQLAASLFVMAWGARLSGFLLFRILRTGKDDRFDGMRDKFFPFLGFWIFQMLWVWIVSLPVTLLNSPAVRRAGERGFGDGLDIAAVVLFALGFVTEALSDAQRYRFRERNRHNKAAVCDVGLFYFSRHPNYFGEIMTQFGIYFLAAGAARGGSVHSHIARTALYASVVAPVFVTVLLMFVSGLPMGERPQALKRWEAGPAAWESYSRYLRRTSILIPFPPVAYERLPMFVKRTLLLEFPLYVFDPEKHAEGGAHQGGEQRDDLGSPTHASGAGNLASGDHMIPGSSS